MTTEELRKRLEQRNLQIVQHRKEYTRRYYQDLAEAKSKGIPVAHTSAVGPAELLYSMGFEVCMPENYCTICASKQIAQPFVEAAEQRGFSRDLCSYSRCALGMLFLNNGPYGALPKPDIVIGNPIGCDPYTKWWEAWAKEYQVPFFIFDVPFNFSGEIQEHELQWVVSELKRLVSFIEEHKLAKFDYAKFQRSIMLAGKAFDLFQEVLNMRKAIPCPRGLRETVGDIFYIVTQVGKQEAVDYMTLLVEDSRERVQHKIGILPQEKFRLFYDNIPIWYRLQLIDYFAQKGAVFVVDEYTNFVWSGYYFIGGRFDPEKPFESLALKLLWVFNNVGLLPILKTYQRCIAEWHCDGAVFFSNRSCKNLSGENIDKAVVLKEKFGIPSMSFEAEMADPRSLYEAEVKARIDAFLELLEQKKEERR